MHIYNKIHVLLSTLSYVFRRLLHHLQGELFRNLRTVVTLFNYTYSLVFNMGLQLDLQLLKNVTAVLCAQ